MKKLNLSFGIGTSVVLALVAFSVKTARQEVVDVSSASFTLPYNFLYGMICWIVFNLLIHYKDHLGMKVKSVAFGITSILCSTLLLFIFDWVYEQLLPRTMQYHVVEGTRLYITLPVRGFIISSMFYFINLYVVILKDNQQHQLEIEKLKQAQLEANISSLKEQLSPHFLFNTLNTLSTLTSEQIVKDYVAQLANVYRYALVNKNNDTASLNEELKFARAYLHILQIRYDEALVVDINMDEKTGNSRVAPFSLQLLVENAMKHNVASLSRPLHISLYNDGDEFIVIENNLQEKPVASNSTGIGLANIMERYKYLFGKEIVILRTDESFTVKLPIVYL